MTGETWGLFVITGESEGPLLHNRGDWGPLLRNRLGPLFITLKGGWAKTSSSGWALFITPNCLRSIGDWGGGVEWALFITPTLPLMLPVSVNAEH